MATIRATRTFSDKFKKIKYKKLGVTDLTVSVCGFGSYRIDENVKDHIEALKFALNSGINLIDTSSNYTDGGSEKLIGKVLNEEFKNNTISRDEIIVVSKGGYLQGENLNNAKKKEEEGNPYKEVVKCSPDLWHCIQPDFLKDQISNSLKRLKLDKIDVYLLHNPEYFLTYSGIPIEERRIKEYNKRIKIAFEYLETEVEKGRISYYGISCNTFGEDEDKNNFTSLEKVFELANLITPENRFAVVQLPMNIFEKGAFKNLNQNNSAQSFLQFAFENKFGILVNRPLNAIKDNKIIRLADFEIKENRNKKEVNDLIEQVDKKETEIKMEYVKDVELPDSERKSLNECLSLAEILKNNMDKIQSVNQFSEIKGYYLIPRANYAIQNLIKINKEDEKLVSTLNDYAVNVNVLMDSVESLFAKEQNDKNKEIHNELNKYLKKDQTKLSLSQKSILMINSLQEVSSTLVGMRKKEYVDDVLGSIATEYIDNAKDFWRK